MQSRFVRLWLSLLTFLVCGLWASVGLACQYCSGYTDVCTGYTDVCTSYTTECTQYQSVCTGYSDQCTGYSDVCTSYDDYGNCLSYTSECDGYVQVCDGYTDECVQTQQVCTGYTSECNSYTQECTSLYYGDYVTTSGWVGDYFTGLGLSNANITVTSPSAASTSTYADGNGSYSSTMFVYDDSRGYLNEQVCASLHSADQQCQNISVPDTCSSPNLIQNFNLRVSTLPVPGNFQVTRVSDKSMTVAWNNSGGAITGYYISINKGSTPVDCTVDINNFGDITGNQFTFNNLSGKTNYSLALCGHDSDGNLSEGTYTAQMTLDPNLPAPTAALTANGLTGTVTFNAGDSVNWQWGSTNGNSASSTYYVASGVNACGHSTTPTPWSVNTLSGNRTDTVPTCEAGSTYVVTYTVDNGVGKTASASVTIVIPALPPPTPTGLTVTANSPFQITSKWTSGGGSTAGFFLAYATGTKAPACNINAGGDVQKKTSVTRSDFTPGWTGTIAVCAYDIYGNFSPEVSQTVTTPYGTGTPPPAPKNVVVNADSTSQYTTTWTSGGGSTAGFYVSYAPGTTAPACGGADLGLTTHQTRGGFTPGFVATITVCAYDSAGNLSTPVSVTQTTKLATGTPPPAPTNLHISADTPNQITTSWTSGGGKTSGYFIGYKHGSTPGACTTGADAGNVLSTTRSDMSPGETIAVAVCAYDADGNVSTAATGSVTTPVGTGTPPPAPSGLTMVSSSPFQMNASWTSGAGSTAGFYVGWGPGTSAPNCTGGVRVGKATTSQSRSDLSSGTTISVSVCAFDATGNISAPVSATQTSQVATGTPPPAPTNFAIKVDSSTQFTSSWTSGGGSTAGYFIAYAPGTTVPDCSKGVNVGTKTSVTRSDFVPSQKITIAVCAYDAAGNVSSNVHATATTNAN